MRNIIFFALLIGVSFVLAPAILELPMVAVGLIFGSFLLFLALTNFELGLMFLLFVIPLSVQVEVTELRGASVDVGADDFFIFLMFLIWLVYLGKTKQAPFVANPLTWPFLGYLAACLTSFIPLLIWGKGQPFVSLLHLLKWYEYVFIYFVLVKCLNTREQIVRFTIFAIACCSLVTFIHAGQILMGMLSGQTDMMYFAHKTTAGFESNGILGAFYDFSIAILLSFFVRYPHTNTRMKLLLLAAFTSFTLFYTFARAAYLGLIAAMICLGFFYRKRFLFIGLLLVFIAPVFLSRAVSERVTMTVKSENMEEMRRQLPGAYRYAGRGGLKLDASSMERILAWQKAKGIIYHHPIFGTGYWSVRYLGKFGFSTAHNFYITTIIETGILGLIMFLWLAGSLLWNAFSFGRTTQDPFYQALAYGITAGFVGILTHCFFGETFESFRMTGPLWMLTGIVFAAKRIDEEKRYDNDSAYEPVLAA